MKILAILAALFLSIGYGHAQTYEKFVEKSFDFLDKNDLVSAEESLRAAMRLEPGIFQFPLSTLYRPEIHEQGIVIGVARFKAHGGS